MDFPPVYGVLNKNQLLRAQNQEGVTDIHRLLSRYTFSGTSAMSLSKCHYTVDFSPVYGTLNENQLLKAERNQEGDSDMPVTVAVYLFLAKNTMSLFSLTWFLGTYVFCSSSKKAGATHTSTK